MAKKLIDIVIENSEFMALNPENKTKEDIIYYTCPVNYNLPDNDKCECMSKDWEKECVPCWNRSK